MEYFISHIGVVFLAACFVAVCAVAWWYLTDKNARLKRQRLEARRAEEVRTAVSARTAQSDHKTVTGADSDISDE